MLLAGVVITVAAKRADTSEKSVVDRIMQHGDERMFPTTEDQAAVARDAETRKGQSSLTPEEIVLLKDMIAHRGPQIRSAIKSVSAVPNALYLKQWRRLFDEYVDQKGDSWAEDTVAYCISKFSSVSDDDTVLELTQRAHDKGWDMHVLYYYRAVAMMNQGDYQKAGSYLQDSLERFPKANLDMQRYVPIWDIHIARARCAYELGHYELMASYYMECVKTRDWRSMAMPGKPDEAGIIKAWDALPLDEKIARLELDLGLFGRPLNGTDHEVFKPFIWLQLPESRNVIEIKRAKGSVEYLIPAKAPDGSSAPTGAQSTDSR